MSDSIDSDEYSLRRFPFVDGSEMLKINLATLKACLLKDDLPLFWNYKSPRHAGQFLDGLIYSAVASRIPPGSPILS